MAKNQTYIAEYIEAYRAKFSSDLFVGIVYPSLMTGPRIRYEFEASSIAEIADKVTAYGNSLGKSLGVFVRPKDPKARKIAGFDKAHFSRMTFNLEPEPDTLRVTG